ncbi:MAG: Crp/Fnr family transcriptional regulator [Planctomycetes bacterium]|nr:Crp/Fnr family transcriptional regulator [Planctomycetota bacterium]
MKSLPVSAMELRSFPLLKPLREEMLTELASTARALEFAGNEVVFRAGEPAAALYGVLSGSVVLYRSSADGREQVVHDTGAGRTIAEAAVFQYGSFPVHARAGTRGARLAQVEGARFLAILDRDPAAMHSVLAALCRRLHELVDRVEILSLPDAGQRLARFLLRLPAEGRAGSFRVRLPVAKKDLAAQLAMTPETLSRVLKRWREQAWAVVLDDEIELLDAAALEQIAAES